LDTRRLHPCRQAALDRPTEPPFPKVVHVIARRCTTVGPMASCLNGAQEAADPASATVLVLLV